MTARSKLCAECKKGGGLRDGLVQEGAPTQESQFDGQFTQTSTRYRCTTCRALWEHELEAGLRGQESHWRLVQTP